ncbi:MAG: hypothetical protein GXP04_03585 [Alphaproteobacteria bacterium]|nr:hypothetical protein [Alphaproteobacteria bacterium]
MPKAKMITKLKMAAAATVVLGMAALAPTASANNSGYSTSAKSTYSQSTNARSGYSVEITYSNNRGRYHRNSHRSRRGHRGQRYNSGYNNSGYNCRKVEKDGYWHGKSALIGGTMCYDSYGQSYIVSGSRYLVSYYGYH